jgi:hypothetical protein
MVEFEEYMTMFVLTLFLFTMVLRRRILRRRQTRHNKLWVSERGFSGGDIEAISIHIIGRIQDLWLGGGRE